MPKVPNIRESERVSFSNPTGLPSNAVANPVGQLGEGLMRLGERFDKIEKAKKKAKSVINRNDYKNMYQAELMEAQADIETGRAKAGFRIGDTDIPGNDMTPSEYLVDRMGKFENDNLKQFPSYDHKELSVAGGALLNKQMVATKQYGRKLLAEEIKSGSNRIINQAMLRLDNDPKANPISIIKELTYDVGTMLNDLGQPKEIQALELNKLTTKLLKYTAMSKANKGDIRGAIEYVDKFASAYADPEEQQATREKLGNVAKAQINFEWTQNRKTKKLKDEQIAVNRSNLLMIISNKMERASVEDSPQKKRIMEEEINELIHTGKKNGNLDFAAGVTVGNIRDKLFTKKSEFKSADLSVAYLGGASPGTLSAMLHDKVMEMDGKEVGTWARRIQAMKNNPVETYKVADAKKLLTSRLISGKISYTQQGTAILKAAQSRTIADATEEMWSLIKQGVTTDIYEAAHLVINKRVRNSTKHTTLEFIESGLPQDNVSSLTTALFKNQSEVKRGIISKAEGKRRGMLIHRKIRSIQTDSAYKDMNISQEKASAAADVLNSLDDTLGLPKAE